MYRKETSTTTIASGTLKKKAERQLRFSISQPPSTGPTAVVIALKPDHVPIARPRSAPSKVALMIARLPGTSNAAPIPCSARATISISGDDAKPQQIDAAVKEATPIRKIRLRPN